MAGQRISKQMANSTSQSIIDGTLLVMAEDGISNLTTKLVSQRADVSTAAIHYFFDTKDKLIYSAFVYMIKSLRAEILSARKTEEDPFMRLRHTIEVNFNSTHLSKDAALIWPQLWVYSGYDQKANRLLKAYSARRKSNFTYDLCAAGLDRAKARTAATKISALIQGLWVESLFGQSATSEECWSIFDAVLADLAQETSKSTKKNSSKEKP